MVFAHYGFYIFILFASRPGKIKWYVCRADEVFIVCGRNFTGHGGLSDHEGVATARERLVFCVFVFLSGYLVLCFKETDQWVYACHG